MITALDIQKKEFDKEFRGFSQDQVNEFLDRIIVDFDKLQRVNKELNQSLDNAMKELARYSDIENTLKETLVIAKTTGEDIIKTSREKAQIIVADSELKAINDAQKAERELSKIKADIKKLTLEFKTMKNKYKSFLESELNFIDEFNIEDIESKVEVK